MPCDRIASATRAPKSTSSTPSGCGAFSTTVAVHPRSTYASAISRPM